MIRSEWVKRNELVILQGERPKWVYFLKEGLIRIETTSERGKIIPIDILYPGEIFGSLEVNPESESVIQAVCLTDSLICRMSSDQFSKVMEMHPEIVFKVHKILSLRIRRIEMAIQDLIFLDVPSRLAKLLYRLASSYGDKHPLGMRIRIRLTHQDVANLIGATREMVSLAIGRLQKENLLIQDKRHFLIPDLNLLKKRFTSTVNL
ncbi:MAG: Crp/Fnr family transcriptional regulator [bacterium]